MYNKAPLVYMTRKEELVSAVFNHVNTPPCQKQSKREGSEIEKRRNSSQREEVGREMNRVERKKGQEQKGRKEREIERERERERERDESR
jgi:hypothetical protein